jgi:hypothetical protein
LEDIDMSYDESSPEEGGWSLKWVILVSMVLIAMFCWCLAAAGYARENLGWRKNAQEEDAKHAAEAQRDMPRSGRWVAIAAMIKAFLQFLWNGVVQLPRFPWVIAHAFTKSIWVVILFGVLEGLAGFLGWKLAALEKELKKESRRQPY